MLQAFCIGYLGSDAVTKTSDGHEFTSFRIAHTDRWTDEAGASHESTQWVDCVINGKPKVADYLKKGTQVFVTGALKSRIYSSAKDRCMKAGLSISVRSVELLGGKSDPVPSKLYDTNGLEHNVGKFFHISEFVRSKKEAEWVPLVSIAGARFVVDRNGFVQPFSEGDNDEPSREE